MWHSYLSGQPLYSLPYTSPNLFGRARFEIDAKAKLRFLDGTSVRRYFLTRSSSLTRALWHCLYKVSRLRAVPRTILANGGNCPVGSCRSSRNFRGPGRQRSRCPYGCRYAARPNVTATREAIPLNRLFERKWREDSKHGMDLKGPCNKWFFKRAHFHIEQIFNNRKALWYLRLLIFFFLISTLHCILPCDSGNVLN